MLLCLGDWVNLDVADMKTRIARKRRSAPTELSLRAGRASKSARPSIGGYSHFERAEESFALAGPSPHCEGGKPALAISVGPALALLDHAIETALRSGQRTSSSKTAETVQFSADLPRAGGELFGVR